LKISPNDAPSISFHEHVAGAGEDHDLVVAILADLGQRARQVVVGLPGEDDRAVIGVQAHGHDARAGALHREVLVAGEVAGVHVVLLQGWGWR
jgi:hypothetical protein